MKSNSASARFFDRVPDKSTERHVELTLSFTEAVQRELDRRGWTQQELADALGVGQPAVSKMLSGAQSLTFRSASRIEAVLDLQILGFLHRPSRVFTEKEPRQYEKVQISDRPTSGAIPNSGTPEVTAPRPVRQPYTNPYRMESIRAPRDRDGRLFAKGPRINRRATLETKP